MRVDGTSISVTMRTPGDDFDLTLGYLLTEGVLRHGTDVAQMMHCLDEDESGSPTYNVVDVALAPDVTVDLSRSERNQYTTERVRGVRKTSIEAITTHRPYAVDTDPVRLSPAVLTGLPDVLRTRQKVFDKTGGLHAAGLFTPEGEALVVRDAVGARDDAVDKVIGWAGREGGCRWPGTSSWSAAAPASSSCRRLLMAGVPVAVSAPSSLAAWPRRPASSLAHRG